MFENVIGHIFAMFVPYSLLLAKKDVRMLEEIDFDCHRSARILISMIPLPHCRVRHALHPWMYRLGGQVGGRRFHKVRQEQT